jgi:hypothetical protein
MTRAQREPANSEASIDQLVTRLSPRARRTTYSRRYPCRSLWRATLRCSSIPWLAYVADEFSIFAEASEQSDALMLDR